jgi:hypothetical protein
MKKNMKDLCKMGIVVPALILTLAACGASGNTSAPAAEAGEAATAEAAGAAESSEETAATETAAAEPITYENEGMKMTVPGEFADKVIVTIPESKEDGVLFTDIPEKTLVRFPPAYHRTTAYIVPDGTKHIAAYAFAGIVRYNGTELISISIADGVVSIGDYAFAHYQEMQMFIYVPDSLTQIGQHLTQFSKGNIPFYVSSRDTAFAQYANQNQLPCGVIRPNEPTDIPLPVSKTPECLPADQMTAPTGEIITVEVEDITLYVKGLTENEKEIILRGCLMNYYAAQNK